ncbi:MAG TPA: glycosyltransferase [Patescibacteria group bacterium]|nr:glycosyltransferase [Patescibacteria group bacterium]
MKKILIIHDRFQFRGGAERLVLDLARILKADIVTEFWTEETYPKSDVPHGLVILDKGEPHAMVFRYFRAQWNFWWKTRKLLKNYDTIIFSGNNGLSAALRPLKGKQTVYYCHSPVRYVYDLLPLRRAAEPSFLKRLVYYDLGKWGIRFLYRLGLSRMQTIMTNSKNVHDRLWRFCRRESRVVYPPIHTERFVWEGQEDFYLSYGRLDGLKRVDDIVRAFQKMPDKKLVIASGGEEAERIAELAKGSPNITCLGWVDDATLKRLVGTCIATLYIPVDEDFGMTPVEGMAAGKPCIGVDEGGLPESIIPNETGLLVPKIYRVEDLVEAVQTLTPARTREMRAACEVQAQRFSIERFEQALKGTILEKKLRLAIDASRSVDGVQKTGVEVVSDALLSRLSCGQTATLSPLFYTPREIPWLPKNAQRVISLPRFWTLIGLSHALLRDRPDALFVPVHTLPFFCPQKTVRAIHDVSFLRTPQAYRLRERLYMRLDLWRAKRLCTCVIVPTQAVKKDLVALLRWPEGKIAVTGWGIPDEEPPPNFSPDAPTTPFVLFIGRMEEKKNVVNLLRAFSLFRETHPTWRLVLAGKPGYGFEKIVPLLRQPGVEELGYVSQEKKAELLSQASMLALVSYEEGFAFPMLEAFRAHVPVLASSIPTLKEIGEDAALFADPNDPEALAASMTRLADEKDLCERLVANGRKNLERYSWDAVVEQIVNILSG